MLIISTMTETDSQMETDKPTLMLPPRALTFDLTTDRGRGEGREGSTTAPVVENERTRFFSFGNHQQHSTVLNLGQR